MHRLDKALVERGIVITRSKATSYIERGYVSVNDEVAKKPSQNIKITDIIKLLNIDKYVSRGGEKLEAAIEHFSVSLKNKVILDIGSSTGGFTDCALSYGAEKVFSVDVGTNQFDNNLRKNTKVHLYEKTDIRNFDLKDTVDFVCVDVSFISLSHIIPEIKRFLKDKGETIVLVKPQFEVGRGNLNNQGLVTDTSLYKKVIDSIEEKLLENDFSLVGVIDSPIKGGSGNREFLIYAIKK